MSTSPLTSLQSCPAPPPISFHLSEATSPTVQLLCFPGSSLTTVHPPHRHLGLLPATDVATDQLP